MFEILNKQILSDGVKRIDIAAPDIARKFRPGQFVSVCPEEGDERVPLSIIEADSSRGIITLMVREVGATTGKLGSLPIHESVFSILGPLGKPAAIAKLGTVVCVATGIGAAQILPICRALRDAGNKVIGVLGASTKKGVLVEHQMRIACNKLFIATEDGSFEYRGKATDILARLLKEQPVHMVYAIGCPTLMRSVADMTKERNIPLRVQLKPVMVDCVGMCGACRVRVVDRMVLACVEGPDFDGYQVDLEDYQSRSETLKEANECPNPRSQLNPNPNGSGILTRFLSGFLAE
ncbi:MAG: sulfide/dihydroorotate dehydrogenase-like FAD/NAD-binding protein [Candidatus Omnitrophica bacterium]|nr:sulfide/dihydroorotate dehydrogenase-like FAD/NAD-binding protein [Candidatus Omnitrophota bacterium]